MPHPSFCRSIPVVERVFPHDPVERWMTAQLGGASSSREALLDAVGTTLRKDGIAKLSLRAVAREAGYSHGAPGALFGDRAGMLSAYAARGFERLATALEAADAAHDDPREALAAIGRAYVGFALQERDCFALMFRDELLRGDLPELMKARQRAWSALSSALHRAQGRGQLDAKQAELVQIGAWSLVHGLSKLLASGTLQRRMDSGGPDPEVLARALTRLYADSVLRAP